MPKIELIQGDCLEKMKDIPDGSVDCIIFDPPYFRCSKAEYDYVFSDKDEWIDWMLNISNESFKCLKDGGSFYVFGGIGTKNGFSFWNYIERLSEIHTFCSYINWKRFRPKGYKGKHNNWGDCREDIGYFCKGKEPKTFYKQKMREAGLSAASKKRFQETGVGLACGNIWIDIPEAQLDGGMNRTLSHPDQKPVLLLERIILASSNEGDTVLDITMGSGTTGVACKNLNRNFIGIEKDLDYFKIAEKRINENI
jgi:site-specific DNA-methyltransferase (adenine-specific)